jgi:hypothetical protein
VEWVTDFSKDLDSLIIRSHGTSASKLHSAATILNRQSQPGMSDTYYLSQTGTLYKETEAGLKILRDQVPLTYDFPIVSGIDSYEARRNDKGEVYFLQPGY